MGTTGTDWSGEKQTAPVWNTQRSHRRSGWKVLIPSWSALNVKTGGGGKGRVYLTGIPGGRSAFIVRKNVKRSSSESSGYSPVLLSVPQEYDAHYHIDS